MNPLRVAMVQAAWTGDKESMIAAHATFARQAATAGADVICFQELFFAPYFCQVPHSSFQEYAETIPGPTTEYFQGLARDLGMVMVLPMYERCTSNRFFNTAAVIDADGTYRGKYRKVHIPHVDGFWEKDYFSPGDLGFPVFDTAVGRIGVYICYDKNFPEGWRALALAGAQIVFNPAAVSGPLSRKVWTLLQPAAALANEFFVVAINRVGVEEYGGNDFYGCSYVADPTGQIIGDLDHGGTTALILRDLDLNQVQRTRSELAFYRDRRPDQYRALVDPDGTG